MPHWHTTCGPVTSLFTRQRAQVHLKDTFSLEQLALGVYDNILGPGESPNLTRFETYGQVLQYLADKIYKGHHMCCPAHTSASFDMGEKVEVKSVVMVPEKSEKPM